MTDKAAQPSGLPLIVRTIWDWDLWVAAVIGIASFFASLVWDSAAAWEPNSAVFVPVVVLSLSLALLAQNQWTSLKGMTRDSDYEELIRLTDETEEMFRVPYTVVIVVSITSMIVSGFAAIVIETLTRNGSLDQAAISILIGLVALFLSWSVLGNMSLVAHSKGHERRLARIKSLRARQDADDRRRRREAG